MDKHKLIRIIAKDLEEIKTLSDEIEVNEEASSLIIDLALSRARLLCQELELLLRYSTPAVSLKDDDVIENFEDDENEEPELSFPEPELEILHFEEADYSNPEVEEEEEMVVYDSEDEENEADIEEDEELEEDDLTEEDNAHDELHEEEKEEEDIVEDIEEDDAIEEHELDAEEYEEVSKLEEEDQAPYNPVQQSVRQMKIDELDEEDDDVQFSPVSSPVNRPVMHEIPKPEEFSTEAPLEEDEEGEEEDEEEDDDEVEVSEDEDEKRATIAEAMQKERSLNETLGENKAETNLSNSPISSLRAAIGLNDRFLFIKEIFSNNSEKYNTIIDQLDKMETIQQAVDYLKVNLSLQKNETSMKFVDLLKRRFTK